MSLGADIIAKRDAVICDMAHEIRKLRDERDALKAQCAKMRTSLEIVLEVAGEIDDETGHQSKHIREALGLATQKERVE